MVSDRVNRSHAMTKIKRASWYLLFVLTLYNLSGTPSEAANRGWIGVRVQLLSNELSNGFGLSHARGVIVAGVDQDSPAERANIEVGDIITAVDDVPVCAEDDLVEHIALFPNRTLVVTVIRNGNEKKIPVTVGTADSNVARQTDLQRRRAALKKWHAIDCNVSPQRYYDQPTGGWVTVWTCFFSNRWDSFIIRTNDKGEGTSYRYCMGGGKLGTARGCYDVENATIEVDVRTTNDSWQRIKLFQNQFVRRWEDLWCPTINLRDCDDDAAIRPEAYFSHDGKLTPIRSCLN